MDETHRIDCPHCGFQGKTKVAPSEGVKMRCTQCKEAFVYHAPTPPALVPVPVIPPSVFKPIAEPKALISPDWVEAKSLKAMENRIRKLERNNRILASACVLVGCLGAAGLAFPRASVGPWAIDDGALTAGTRVTAPIVATGEIVAQKLTIVDSKANPVLECGYSEQAPNHGVITIRQAGDASRLSMSNKGVSWYDDAGKLRMIALSELPSRKDGMSFFNIFDQSGKIRINLHAADKEAALDVRDRRENNRILLGVKEILANGLNIELPYISYFAKDDGQAAHVLRYDD